ncbi:succinate--CoA ligase beta chain [Spiromyces aspiralis]|uniref:Succinate--CoA ligase beta chain n=1 Tax=Spiromyces aspiralis TaxID=68401 RepID=A0ACC1HGG3_9FUNG|nr:succinate--CoA ligase beta chain [Spiromyces aspiralis]
MFKLFVQPAKSAFRSAGRRVLQNQTRNLSIHEYLSANLLSKAGVKVPKGVVATTPEEAYQAAKTFGR